jgi:predicted phage terminase large subunit-like protein
MSEQPHKIPAMLTAAKRGRNLRAERYLKAFITAAWPVVQPGTDFIDGPHLDALCEHLTAVTRGEIRNLLINVPPRHMKSLAVGVFWPAWEWIFAPQRRWLFASYAANLSERDSNHCRRLIQSQWYRHHWGDRFMLCPDQNAKHRFENDKSGSRIATSVGGWATGEGGDRVVVDDPHNVVERESEPARLEALRWWDESMSTRLNDPKTGAKVIVMQRIHEKDLSGHVLEQGGYVHLCLPAEFEPSRRCVTVIGWRDWRTAEGDLLWPARVGPEEIAGFKRSLGSNAYAGQFQQRPAPAGGARFRAEWFRYFTIVGAAGTDECDAGTPGRGDAGKEGEEKDARTPRRGDAGKDECDVQAATRPTLPRSKRRSRSEGGDAEKGGDDHRSARIAEPPNAPFPASPRPRVPASHSPSYALHKPDGTQTLVPVHKCDRFAVMDPAGTEPGHGTRPCYTVIQVWDVTPTGDMLLVHQYRKQVQAPAAAAAAVRVCKRFNVPHIAIEKDGMGLGVVQEVRSKHIVVKAIKARGSKEARSETAEIKMESGQIYFPRGAEFLFDLEQELLQFPRSEYADQVDALAHAARQVRPGGGKERQEATDAEAAEDDRDEREGWQSA